MVKMIALILVVGMFLTPTLAMAGTSQDTPLSFAEQRTISNEYIAALFGKDAIAEGSQPIQLAMLSDAELKETEGALVPLFLKKAIGPVSAWVRIGRSYSRSSGISTIAIRWGSNPHHAQKIGSPTLRGLNQSLRGSRIPINNWRTNDAGHLHLWRR